MPNAAAMLKKTRSFVSAAQPPLIRPCRVHAARSLKAAAWRSGNDHTVAPPVPGTALVSAGLAAAVALALPGVAYAAKEKVGEFEASGFLFKDSVEVTALDDGDIPGVTIYISDFKRSLVDKLQKDFFSEPSQSSLTCSAAADITLPPASKLGGTEGKEVFSEKKGLSIFKDKTLRVRRVWDADRRTLIYVAFSTRLSTAADEGQVSTGRYRTSICALHIPEQQAPALAAAVPEAAAAS